MRIVFGWTDVAARHANVLNAVRKMILASGLPFEPAKINVHWPRFVYGPVPAQGIQVEREYLDIYLREIRSEAEVTEALKQAAPKEMVLLQVTRVPYPLPSVQNLAAAVRYRVKGDFSPLLSSGRKIEGTGAEKLLVSLRAENGMMLQQDIGSSLLEARRVAQDEIVFTAALSNNKWVPPQWYVAAWLGIELPAREESVVLEGFTLIRQTFLWKDSQGEFHPI